jgi:hypothetical protein
MARGQPEVKLLSLVDVLKPISEEELRNSPLAVRTFALMRAKSSTGPKTTMEAVPDLGRSRARLQADLLGRAAHPRPAPRGDSALGPEASGLHARALEPSVLSFMRREDLEYFLRRKPEMGLYLVDHLAERLRLVHARMSDVVHKKEPARLASVILWLLSQEGGVQLRRRRIHDRNLKALQRIADQER